MATISDRYSEDASFELLLTRLSVGNNEIARLQSDGFTNTELLVKHFAYDVKGFREHLLSLNKSLASATGARRVYFNPIITNRLLGILHYFDQAIHTYHSIPDIDEIDSDMADLFGKQYQASLRTKVEDEEEIVTKIPDLTGANNWRDFKEKFIMKLSTIKGTRGIPIDYVVDTTIRNATRANAAKIEVAIMDVPEDEIIRSTATHFGSFFKEDSKRVLIMLKKLLLNKPAYNHIAEACKQKNGKRAFFDLEAYYEGEDYVERNIVSAFETLNNTFYKGETKAFKFEKYVAKHLEGHRLLFEANYNSGNGMDNATKIQHLKAGIKLDAGLEHALTTARTNKLAQGDFGGFVSFLAAEVGNRNVRLKQLNTSRSRMVAGLQGGFRGGRGGRGRGNTFRGRGGRGRGNYSNSNNRGPILSATVDGKTVESRSYSKAEFSALTGPQRNKVIDLNKQRRNNSANNSSGNHTDAHSVSQISTSISAAIVEGVKQASQSNNSDDFTDDASTKRKAESGGVGEFIANRRKKTSNKQD